MDDGCHNCRHWLRGTEGNPRSPYGDCMAPYNLEDGKPQDRSRWDEWCAEHQQRKMGGGVSDLVKRGEGRAGEAQKREAEDMGLAWRAYKLGRREALDGVQTCDPRVVVSKSRAE